MGRLWPLRPLICALGWRRGYPGNCIDQVCKLIGWLNSSPGRPATPRWDIPERARHLGALGREGQRHAVRFGGGVPDIVDASSISRLSWQNMVVVDLVSYPQDGSRETRQQQGFSMSAVQCSATIIHKQLFTDILTMSASA